MIGTIMAAWPLIKWALQALGFMGPEDKEAEKNYRLKLMEAAERKDAALMEAFAEFQKLWRPGAERVYVWANTAIALFQPLVIAAVYWDVFFGAQKSVQVGDRLGNSIGGLFVLSIMMFPYYGPALVKGVQVLFEGAAQMLVTRVTSRVAEKPKELAAGETETERLSRLNDERNAAIIKERGGSLKPDETEDDNRSNRREL